MLNVAADFALVAALLFVYAWDPGQPLRTLLYLVVLEAALFFRLRGGLLVGGADGAGLRGGGVVARVRVRLPGRDRLDRAPRADRARARWHRRAPRRHGARPGARRRGARRGGRAAPRRARATHRRARGHEPRRPRARLLARPRRGVRGVRPGAARPPALRPRGDPARRGKQRPRDGDRRDRGRGVPRSRNHDPRRGLESRAGDRPGPHGLPGGHLRPAAIPTRRACSSSGSGRACSRRCSSGRGRSARS